jgi:hypothetical protein
VICELLPPSITFELGPSFHDNLRRVEFAFVAAVSAFEFAFNAPGVAPEN